MSAPGEQYPPPEEQGGDDGGASEDLGSFLDVVVRKEWLVLMIGEMVRLAFQMVVGSFEKEEDEQKVAQPASDEDQDIQPVEEKDQEEEEGEEDSEEEGEAAERGVVGAETGHDIVAPKSLSLLAKKALLRYYETSDEEAEETEGKEEEEEGDKNEELEEGPKKCL